MLPNKIAGVEEVAYPNDKENIKKGKKKREKK